MTRSPIAQSTDSPIARLPMSFLDRFKLHPKWKNADPNVRVSAVAEMPNDDEHLAILRELARDDVEAQVRRTAGERLHKVEDIIQLARAEKDERIRRDYVDRLIGVAIAGAPTD